MRYPGLLIHHRGIALEVGHAEAAMPGMRHPHHPDGLTVRHLRQCT
jgi:hypothetical protein